MTAAQFALAVGADPAWVRNAARGLGRRLRYTEDEARWLGLVRLLNERFAISLRAASEMASVALALPPSTRAIRLLESDDGSAAIVLDVARYHSTFSASLSRVLTLGTTRRHGGRAHSTNRDPVERAKRFGVDLDLLRASLALTLEERLARLDSNAALLSALREERTRVLTRARRGE
jgi:hypothetical protein